VVRIALPAALSRYVVEKGSITVDGVSLTVSALGADEPLGGRSEGSEWFEVSLIPTTLGLTTLGRAAAGTPVNLEVDVIAKYVERLLSARGD
jgi:riboflavin synthase